MALVFKTPKDQHETVEIVGVGVVPAHGEGGVPVDAVPLPELEGVGKSDYKESLEKWAESRGLVVEDAKKEEVDALRPSAASVDLWAIGRQGYVAAFGDEDAGKRPKESVVSPAAPVESAGTAKADQAKEDRK